MHLSPHVRACRHDVSGLLRPQHDRNDEICPAPDTGGRSWGIYANSEGDETIESGGSKSRNSTSDTPICLLRKLNQSNNHQVTLIYN